MILLSFSDWLRVVNFVLGVVVAVWIMVDRYGPWRTPDSPSHLLAVAASLTYFWLGYTGLEILMISRTATTAPEAARVIGGTVCMLLGVVAMAERHHRCRLQEQARLAAQEHQPLI